jgi:integrase
MKVCILLMAGSGLRLGALTDLKLRHLQDNRLIVYEGSNEEYMTFATQETLSFIKEYLDYRARFGEKMSQEAHLIRNDFDSYGNQKEAKAVSKNTIRNIIYHLIKKAGIEGDILHTHAFRKFFTTQLINSKVNSEVREMLLGHKIGLASSYYRPTEGEMYAEYEKALDSLTINEENRLRRKVDILQEKKDEIRSILERIHKLEKRKSI